MAACSECHDDRKIARKYARSGSVDEGEDFEEFILVLVSFVIAVTWTGRAHANGWREDAPSKGTRTREDAGVLLQRAKDVMRFGNVAPDRVLHYHAGAAAEMNFQSDRSAAFYFRRMKVRDFAGIGLGCAYCAVFIAGVRH